MSFSSKTKSELCKEVIGKKCCAAAEAYGALLYANSFSLSLIRFITSSPDFVLRLPKLFSKAFGVSFDASICGKGGKHSLSITDSAKIQQVFTALDYDPKRTLVHHINLPLLENECDQAAFLRGCFLSGGSVTDPKARYHLELATMHASVSRELHAFLLELSFEPKDLKRGSAYVTYFKQSSAVEDFLTLIGAPITAMDVMQAKVEKDMTNSINRLTNCDMANADKVADAAQLQLRAIRKIESGTGLDSLSPALQQTAFLRIANPECSLSDLAQLSTPPVTKSCLAHRMNKLIEISGIK